LRGNANVACCGLLLIVATGFILRVGRYKEIRDKITVDAADKNTKLMKRKENNGIRAFHLLNSTQLLLNH
jgi:hypothetical protein